MTIVVSDTNILIDLIDLELLDVFFELPLEITTTDLVIYELDEIKQAKIFEASLRDKIDILESTEIQLNEVQKIYDENRGISLTDSQVFYFAIEKGAILLSGDGNLRRFAKKRGLEVRGIIWVFDLLEKNKILSPRILSKKMKTLLEINTRLPQEECLKRIQKWEKF